MTQELPPRPWDAVMDDDGDWEVKDAAGELLGWPDLALPPSIQEAVALRWAAAPELAEALEAALAELRRYEGGAAPADQAVLLQAEAALARARGEAVGG